MSDDHEVPAELEETDSYDLAQVEPEEPGPVQRVSSSNRKGSEISYKPSSKTLEEPLAAGLSNEDLWMLIRRFNKQIYYVRAAEDPPPAQIDLNRTNDEHYPPEKLRMTLERFYISVIVGFTNFFKHIGRLRSWNEPVRTSIFCAVYFTAWLFDLLVPTIAVFLMSLILFSPIRPFLFPAAPDNRDGSDADSMKSSGPQPEWHNSVTGAPERHKGEAAEQEANNLVNSMATVAMESATAKYGQGVATDETAEEDPAPDTSNAVIIAPEPQGDNVPSEDKTKKPMKKKVSKATNQTMRVISDITDIYERFANVLSPTPPFYSVAARLQLTGILLAVCFAGPMLSSYMIVKAGAFLVGFGFFGDPIFQSTVDFLNRKVPAWKDQLDINKTLLKGVPNNAQLTLTLLRIGEINSAPLPPPPSTGDNEPAWPIPRKKSSTATTTSATTTTAVTDPNTPPALPPRTSSGGGDSPELPPKPKKKFISKLFKFFRRTISTAIKGHVAIDRAMAITGAMHTRNLIGMIQKKGWISAPYGPLKFDAKFERKRGTVIIDSSKEPPLLYFTTTASAKIDEMEIEQQKKGNILFQIPVSEIRELKKTEGLGWKGKLIVELTAGSKEAADGLIISGCEEGQSFHLTGMRARNQLFNRLVAIDAKFWESR